MTNETERAEQVIVQLQSAQAQMDEHSKKIQEKTSQIHTVTLEAQGLKQELQTSTASSAAVSDQLREEVSELRNNLADEKERGEI